MGDKEDKSLELAFYHLGNGHNTFEPKNRQLKKPNLQKSKKPRRSPQRYNAD